MNRNNILKSSRSIDHVINKGKKINTNFLFITYVSKPSDSKIAIAVSKKLGNAVHRNKLKRQIRNILIAVDVESFNKWVVIVPKKHWLDLTFEQKSNELINSLNKIT